MRCLKRYNETEEMPVFSFSPDANFPAVYAEKGQMQITMKRDFPLQGFEPIKLLGLTCGERVNVVPDTAYAYFSGDCLYFLKGENLLNLPHIEFFLTILVFLDSAKLSKAEFLTT